MPNEPGFLAAQEKLISNFRTIGESLSPTHQFDVEEIKECLIPQPQRDSMERIAKQSIGTNAPIGTKAIA